MRDGKLTRIDEAAILAEALAAYEELRPAIDVAEAAMARCAPPTRRSTIAASSTRSRPTPIPRASPRTRQ